MHFRLCALLTLSFGSLITVTLAGTEGRGNGIQTPPFPCDDAAVAAVATQAAAPNFKKRYARAAVGEDKKAKTNTPSTEEITKRAGTVNYDPSCNAAPPLGSGYGNNNGFPTMKSVLQQAYADAVSLANGASVLQQSNPAYTHYFDSISPQMQLHFFSMMTQIANNIQYYTITFRCTFPVALCGTGGASAAVTDASAGTATDNKIIDICSVFFTSARTGYLLYDQTKGANPARPYRDNSQTGWCNPAYTSNDYATAGHTILHELTHLDSLASAAGLTAPTEGDDAGRHGTGDYQTGCELQGARDHLTAWDDDDDDNVASPDYNAESYAGAATEFYFMTLCNIASIPF